MFKNALLIATALLSATAFAATEATAQLVDATQRLNAQDVTPADTSFGGLTKRDCPNGYGYCSNGGCCPIGGECCILNACCNPGYYCVRNAQSTRVGCCPNGEVCSSP
ncbi:hypothetical protein BJ138DRAFT_1009659 [Hygrophoropsis aurantiaca]|uniref:Uncharacterized protein n=1 Tax=Hygrophoropsis aurantiaca TaxID=72124 RepID=A0ACB8A9V8_9AGAM|nr:hypothetical protein BJ138DRAFT_1009659 [Hygrophoropsis aurantiaca]